MMCGIGGLLYKTPNHQRKTGEVVIRMLQSLYRRGPDSTGVALLHENKQDCLYVDITYEKEGNGVRIIDYLNRIGKVKKATDHGQYVRATVSFTGSETELVNGIDQLDDDISVANIGNRIEVLKYMGGASNLEKQFQVSEYDGPVALGHTRMATESKVDISHSQPLSARAIKDISIIHNGHVTNYINLRSFYENKGYTFTTGNDSEVIAVYLVDKMAQGADLKEAMQDSIRELDGSFTYLAVTPDAVGLAKEPFGMKPMVIAETDEFVAFASESVAIRNGFEADLKVSEPGVGEVLVWKL
jgi:glutamine phosphoribosylpyrophosphate amidotransferase